MFARYRRSIAWFLLWLMLFELAAPGVALAGGPNPDFAGFVPAGSGQLVDLYSGGLNYAVPVLEVPNGPFEPYKMNLSYNSDISVDDEASWVGWGWSLTPGAIQRQLRGFPDEFRETNIVRYSQAPATWVGEAKATDHPEIFSYDPLDAAASLAYSNKQGFSRTFLFSISESEGPVSGQISFSRSPEGTGMSFNFNSSVAQRYGVDVLNSITSGPYVNAVIGNNRLANQIQGVRNSVLGISNAPIQMFTETGRPPAVPEVTSVSFTSSKGIETFVPFLHLGNEFGLKGQFSIQAQNSSKVYKADGYIYSKEAAGADQLSDYFSERGAGFDKKQMNLPIPLPAYDQFMVSCEGLSGGFRFQKNKPGIWSPNTASVKSLNLNTGWALGQAPGQSIALGLTLGAGGGVTTHGLWDIRGNTDRFRTEAGLRNGFFHFNHDPAGNYSYTNGGSSVPSSNVPAVVVPKLDRDPVLSAIAKISVYAPNVDEDVKDQPIDKSVSKYIRPIVGADSMITGFIVVDESGMEYRFEHALKSRCEAELQAFVPSQQSGLQDVVYGNLSLFKSSDSTVDSKVEDHFDGFSGEIRNKSYAHNYLLTSVSKPGYWHSNCSDQEAGDIKRFHYYRAYGSSSSNWFASRTPYTGLSYSHGKIADKTDQRGSVRYSEKQISYLKAVETRSHIAFFVTNKSASSRYTELLTKYGIGTTIQSQLSGSQSLRKDGLSAAILASTYGANDPSASTPFVGTETTRNSPEYLEKIVLVPKNGSEVLRTVRFVYDYSLCRNQPNSAKDGQDRAGKLTLIRVIQEEGHLFKDQVRSYEFKYGRKNANEYPDYVRADYDSILPKFDPLLEENPIYDPLATDPWGQQDAYAAARRRRFIGYKYQGDSAALGWQGPASWAQGLSNVRRFDPGQYRLKQVILPEGGEILIDYEQKDYQYVQNRYPMAMASLLMIDPDRGEISSGTYKLNPAYIINPGDLGLPIVTDTSTSSNAFLMLKDQLAAIRSHFATDPKVYYKFLYSMWRGGGEPDVNSCYSDWIEGYAEVDLGGTYIKKVTLPGGRQLYAISLQLRNPPGAGRRPLGPRQAMYDYAVTQRNGMTSGGDCESDMSNSVFARRLRTRDAQEKLLSFNPISMLSERVVSVSPFLTKLSLDLVNPNKGAFPSYGDIGSSLKVSESFMRIPMTVSKRGGGARVTKVFYYDAGLENGDSYLFGKQYFYHDVKEGTNGLRIISSGVSTSEPGGVREENPFVRFMGTNKPTWVNMLLAGKNQEDSEGPLGESLMPGASIGHSRVIVQDINTSETGTGHSIEQFYTYRDYPFDGIYSSAATEDSTAVFDYGDNNLKGVEYSRLEDGMRHEEVTFGLPENSDTSSNPKAQSPKSTEGSTAKKYNSTKLQMNVGLMLSKDWAMQGYRFVLNDMPGKQYASRSYQQSYSLRRNPKSFVEYPPTVVYAPTVVTEQITEYYKPGEMLTLAKNADDAYEMGIPGKEGDLTFEMRNVRENSMNISVEIDLTFGYAPVPVVLEVPTVSIKFDLKQMAQQTMVASEVTRYPAYVKSTTTIKEGIEQRMENLVFDKRTATPLMSRNTDAYGKWMYSLNIPARFFPAYTGMGLKSASYANSNELATMAGQVSTYDFNPAPTSLFGLDYQNVLSAQVQTYRRDWSDSPYGLLNKVDARSTVGDLCIDSCYAGALSFWQPYKAYSIAAPSKTGSVLSSREMGYIDNFPGKGDMKAALGGAIPSDPRWLLVNDTRSHTLDGFADETAGRDGIVQSVQYARVQSGAPRMPMMLMQATNAERSAIYFNSYEGALVSLSNYVVSNQAHTGLTSIHHSVLASTTSDATGLAAVYSFDKLVPFNFVPIWQTVADSGFASVWIQGALPSDHLYILDGLVNPASCYEMSNPTESDSVRPVYDQSYKSRLYKVIEVGSWQLFQAKFPFRDGKRFFYLCRYGLGSSCNLYVDDFRFSPKRSSVACYVYDATTLKPQAVFDTYHMPMLYEYDNDGNMTRTLKESEQGRVVLKESKLLTKAKPRKLR